MGERQREPPSWAGVLSVQRHFTISRVNVNLGCVAHRDLIIAYLPFAPPSFLLPSALGPEFITEPPFWTMPGRQPDREPLSNGHGTETETVRAINTCKCSHLKGTRDF